jgi:hypothetical protein
VQKAPGVSFESEAAAAAVIFPASIQVFAHELTILERHCHEAKKNPCTMVFSGKT